MDFIQTSRFRRFQAFDKFENFPSRNREIAKLVLPNVWKSGKESFNVKLEVKIIAKSLALYKDYAITSGTFIMLLNDALPLLHILLNSRYVLFLSRFHSSLVF